VDQHRLLILLEGDLEDRLTEAERAELDALLRDSPQAQARYWDFIEQHVLIQDILAESRGEDLALLEEGPVAPAAEVAPGAVPLPARFWHRTRAAALLAIAALVGVGLALWRQPAPQPERAAEAAPRATVQSLIGEVHVRDASGIMVVAVPGSPLFSGQALRVGEEDSRVDVVLTDGTEVTLSSGSSLRFPAPEQAPGNQVHLEQGAARVHAALRAAQPALVVTTDHTRVVAQAARFRLYREEKASRVELEEGKVRLEGRDGLHPVEVAERLFVVATDEPVPVLPQPLPVGQCRLRHRFLAAGEAVAMSADGRRVVAGNGGRDFRAWDTADGKPVGAALRQGHAEWPSELSFTGSADMVVSLGNRGTASLWKLTDPRASQTPLGGQDLRCAAVSGDGRWLAQARRSGEIAVWEVDAEAQSLSLRQTLTGKAVRLALSSGGRQLVVGQWDGEINVLDVKSKEKIARYKVPRTPTALAISPDSRWLAAYANAESLVLFDQSTGTHQTLWSGMGVRVAHLRFAADGRVLLAALEDGTVRAWSTADGTCLLVLETGHRRVSRVAAADDLSLLATVGYGNIVNIWECKLP